MSTDPPGMDEHNLRRWASLHAWAVTAVEDYWGHPPGDQPTGYALYDADEDDPPVAVFTFREDALMVAAILNAYTRAARPRATPADNRLSTEREYPACPDGNGVT